MSNSLEHEIQRKAIVLRLLEIFAETLVQVRVRQLF